MLTHRKVALPQYIERVLCLSRQGLDYPLLLGPLIFWLHSESHYACGERAEVWLGSCGQIGEGLFQNIF